MNWKNDTATAAITRLLLGILIMGMAQNTYAAKADTTVDKTKAPVIFEITIDFDAAELHLTGFNFMPETDDPVIYLGNDATPLVLEGVSDTSLIAHFPPAIPDGEYMLLIENSRNEQIGHDLTMDRELSEAEVDAYVANNGYSTGPHLTAAEVEAIVSAGLSTLETTVAELQATVSGQQEVITVLETQLATAEANVLALETGFAAHGSDTAAHHARYADAEAIAAVGPHYTDGQAIAAVGPHFSGNHDDLVNVNPDQHHADSGPSIASLEEILGGVTRAVDPNTDQDTIFFSGMNVQINNGTGINRSANGTGNLIMGYNGKRPDDECESGGYRCNRREGSHNIITGFQNNYSSWGGIINGRGHESGGGGSILIGGSFNTAEGARAVVIGGSNNFANGQWSTVTGGHGNSANGLESSISGGWENTANGDTSSVSGGEWNTADGPKSSVSGGQGNLASGTFASVTGGTGNTAGAEHSSVTGGVDNSAIGGASSVNGGWGNTASEAWATVSGGRENSATGQFSTVSGGWLNIAGGSSASVSAGVSNSAAGDWSSVTGGVHNTANGEGSWASGREGASVDDDYASFAGLEREFYPHIGDAAAHHDRYADDEAISAVGPHYTDDQAIEAVGPHYSDHEAIAAVGPHFSGSHADLNDVTPDQHHGDPGATIANLESLLTGVNRDTDPNTGQDTITFDGMNVQIVNGTGWTNTTNGRGNLIIGYNHIRDDVDDPDHREGSHMLVVGEANNYRSFGGIVVGTNNETSGEYASVTGGQDNTASGAAATVSGGEGNLASGYQSSVSGGGGNVASNGRTSILGGQNNTASGDMSAVSGGYNNTANGTWASILGGDTIETTDDFATVSGLETAFSFHTGDSGAHHEQFGDAEAIAAVGPHYTDAQAITAVGPHFSGDHDELFNVTPDQHHGDFSANVSYLENLLHGVSRGADPLGRDTLQFQGMNLQLVNGEGITDATNGLGNLVIGYNDLRLDPGDPDYRDGSHMLVIGDFNNYTAGSWGGMVVGSGNETSAPWSTVSGGERNIASGHSSVVTGGWNNTASGHHATVTGGNRNTASGFSASVTGGFDSAAHGDHASVNGGANNLASGNHATVAGGQYNDASGETASIGGGQGNIASGQWSSVSGGLDNRAEGDHTSVSGGQDRVATSPTCWTAGPFGDC